jgi:DNA-binding NarL/FixJ family response regulator
MLPAMPDQVTAHVVRIAVIEDERDIREGLATLLRLAGGFQCTGSYRSMEEAIDDLKREVPDVALVDIGLPGMNGIDGIRLLKQRHPGLRLMMLTVFEEDDFIFDALCAGACGYLLKKTAPTRLIESVREVMDGGAPMSPEVASKVIRLFREIRPPDRADYQLTPHELRVLRMLVDGHHYKTAAAELGVSVPTVAFHVRNIYEKLQVHSKSEAVAKALRSRLV